MQTKEGNHLIETRYHVATSLPRGPDAPLHHPLLKHWTHSVPGWMNIMNSVLVENDDGEMVTPDAWKRLYKLTTVQKQNAGRGLVCAQSPASWMGQP